MGEIVKNQTKEESAAVDLGELFQVVQAQHELIVYFYRRVVPFMDRVQKYVKDHPEFSAHGGNGSGGSRRVNH